jgi:sulfoxide reductase heme-binding subunit YedZ
MVVIKLKTLSQKQITFFVKPILFLLCLMPFILLVLDTVNNNLGANPVEEMTHRTGEWALRFLLIALTITPLRKMTGANWLIKIRRMFGLYVFFYALMHFITYIWLDQNFDWMEILIDIPKRPFITVGFTAFVLLIPLALTSTNKMMRRLKKNWQRLHKLVYVIAMLGVLHFLWVVKADTLEPLVYAVILLGLFLFRAADQRRKIG